MAEKDLEPGPKVSETPKVPKVSGAEISTRPSLVNRFGTISAILFFGSIVAIAFSIIFLAFLWFSNSNNSTWQQIIAKNLLKQCITLLSTVIRFGIAIQVGLCLSMAASIALESYLVPRPYAPTVSIMRLSGGGLVGTLKDFLYPVVFKGKIINWRVISLASLTLGILITSTLLQFISTALLFDTSEVYIPSNRSSFNTTIEFTWKPNLDRYSGQFEGAYDYPTSLGPKITWVGDIPSVYPIFAEYHEEPAPGSILPNSSDTGVTLRGFLPMGTQSEREGVIDFDGDALVMDQRVICVQPVFHNFTINNDGYYFSATVTPKQEYPNMHLPDTPPEVTLNYGFWYDGDDSNAKAHYFLYQIASEPNSLPDVYVGYTGAFGGSLHSELREDNKTLDSTGAAYILLRTIVDNDKAPGPEWVNIPLPGVITDNLDGTLVIHATLCYTALDTGTRHVSASRNITGGYTGADSLEPTWHNRNRTYIFDDVFQQIIPSSSNGKPSSQRRSVLQMQSLEEDGTWVNATGEYLRLPFIPNALELRPFISNDPTSGSGTAALGNSTVAMGVDIDEAAPSSIDAALLLSQPWMLDFFNQALANYTTAEALQSVIHVLSAGIYYKQQPNFDQPGFANVYSTAVHLVATGWGPKGYPIFFTIVCAIIVVHHLIVFTLLWKFITECELSRIGDAWQAIAQIALTDDENTKNILTVASKLTANRDMASEQMEKMGAEKDCMGLGRHPDGTVVLLHS
ncbi:Mitochondrial outer membrane protein iml2 [Orbilia ellipsospora]|uniref:Mitochondrial outer membrane protein iml2 n=1 Tax=Orbilia ellipsospora TaxID=2528407 RepID=A0AAV9WRW2_9PEZI